MLTITCKGKCYCPYFRNEESETREGTAFIGCIHHYGLTASVGKCLLSSKGGSQVHHSLLTCVVWLFSLSQWPSEQGGPTAWSAWPIAKVKRGALVHNSETSWGTGFLNIWETLVGSSLISQYNYCLFEELILPLPPSPVETLFPLFFYLYCTLPTL